MESNEISRHEVGIFATLQQADTWLTSRQIATQAHVAPRTARQHLLRFVQLNIIDVAEVFPGHRYRIPDDAAKRNRGYLDRLERAADVFGIAL